MTQCKARVGFSHPLSRNILPTVSSNDMQRVVLVNKNTITATPGIFPFIILQIWKLKLTS